MSTTTTTTTPDGGITFRSDMTVALEDSGRVSP